MLVSATVTEKSLKNQVFNFNMQNKAYRFSCKTFQEDLKKYFQVSFLKDKNTQKKNKIGEETTHIYEIPTV